MDGILIPVAAMACGVALFYVVTTRTARKRQQERLDAEAREAMRRMVRPAA